MAGQCENFPSLAYEPGNFQDRVKIGILEILLSEIEIGDNFVFFDAHSGEGSYSLPEGVDFNGTAATAIQKLCNRIDPLYAFLNEAHQEAKDKLTKNMAVYKNMVDRRGKLEISGDWRQNLEMCLHYYQPDGKNSLFISDPNTIGDHIPVIGWMPELLKEFEHLFMYVPEGIGKEYQSESIDYRDRTFTHKSAMNLTYENLKTSGRDYIDLTLPSEKSPRERTDHYIVISNNDVLQNIKNNYSAIIKRAFLQKISKNPSPEMLRLGLLAKKLEDLQDGKAVKFD